MTTATGSKLIFTAIAAIGLACAPSSMFAQRGGGHGGGGGGFHGGGGGGSRGGGGFSGGARSYSGGSYRGGSYGGGSSRPSAPAYSGGGARLGGNTYRPGPGANSYRPPAGGSAGSAQAARNGQWHSFAPPNSAGSRGGVTTGTGTFAGGRNAFVGNPTFGGFGRGGVGSGFGGVGFRNGFRGRPGLGFGFPAFRSRFGFGGFDGFGGFGGFGFGFGSGLGFGWGPCWGAAWAWDPFCFDSFAAWPAYGYYDYPPDPYAYPPSVGYDPNYSSGYDPDNPAPGASTNVPPGPVNDTSADTPSAAAQSQVPVVIYFRDGSSVLPSDYWMSDNRFYYVLGGEQNSVPLSRVDLAYTNDVNHRNGATFWLKSAPNDTAPAGQPPAVAPASPQNDNAGPGPAVAPQSVPDAALPATL